MEANTSGVLLRRGTTLAQPFSGAFLAPTTTGLLHFLRPLLQSVPAAPVADGTSLHSTPRVGLLFLHQSVLATSRAVSSVSTCPHTRTRTRTHPPPLGRKLQESRGRILLAASCPQTEQPLLYHRRSVSE